MFRPNGAEIFFWPDGGNSPFRGEKGTTYEGGFRVPMVVKWPGTIKPGRIITDKFLNGLKVGEKDFKNHLDGYNFLPFRKGDAAEGRGRNSSTSRIMATSTRYDTATGSSASRRSRAASSLAPEIQPTFPS